MGSITTRRREKSYAVVIYSVKGRAVIVMPCPYCRQPSPTEAYVQCANPDGTPFVLCPACDGCIPVTSDEVLPELEPA